MTLHCRAMAHREYPAKGDAVPAVRSPHDPWKSLARTLPTKSGIAFEPY